MARLRYADTSASPQFPDHKYTLKNTTTLQRTALCVRPCSINICFKLFAVGVQRYNWCEEVRSKRSPSNKGMPTNEEIIDRIVDLPPDSGHVCAAHSTCSGELCPV